MICFSRNESLLNIARTSGADSFTFLPPGVHFYGSKNDGK